MKPIIKWRGNEVNFMYGSSEITEMIYKVNEDILTPKQTPKVTVRNDSITDVRINALPKGNFIIINTFNGFLDSIADAYVMRKEPKPKIKINRCSERVLNILKLFTV